jgi:hypothetical protein
MNSGISILPATSDIYTRPMISSEIAKSSGRVPRSRTQRKVGALKSNPRPLTPQDGVVLGGGLDQDKNLSNGGQISAVVSEVRVMLPPGSGREQSLLNSGAGAQVQTKSGVAKYANPRPIDVNGQMWNVV